MGILLLAGEVRTQTPDEKAVRKILADQQQQWNAGSITSFMEGYWKNDSLMFIGKRGVTYGWQQTLDNYISNYPDTAAMGQLAFDLLEVKRLSVIYFFVVGKWQLTRSAGNLNGAFTLLIRKLNGKWVIISDHSS